jgi:hypothetical protein
VPPRASAWASRSINFAAPQASVLTPRSSTFDAQ